MMCRTNLGLLTWYVFSLSKKHTIAVIMYLLRVCKAPMLQRLCSSQLSEQRWPLLHICKSRASWMTSVLTLVCHAVFWCPVPWFFLQPRLRHWELPSSAGLRSSYHKELPAPWGHSSVWSLPVITGMLQDQWLLGPASRARTDRPGPTGDHLPLFVGLEFCKCISGIMLIAILESLHQLSLWGL